MAVTERAINAWFGDHWLRGLPPTARRSVARQLGALREAARAILAYTPKGAEQTRAITRLRDQLDEVLLKAWRDELPGWHDHVLGDHALRGFRQEDRDTAAKLLDALRCAASDLDGGSTALAGVWQAAARAIRCRQ